MTAHLADRTDPDDPADDDTWWDRHGWDGAPPATGSLPGRSARDPDPSVGDGDRSAGDRDRERDTTQRAGVAWSTLLVGVAVLGGLITLPVLGFAGGLGRVLAPTAWAFVGLRVGVGLSDREPRWDLADPRRVEPLVWWVVAYAVTALVGLHRFEGVTAWWVPGTVGTAVLPFAVARVPPAAAITRGLRRLAARDRTRRLARRAAG